MSVLERMIKILTLYDIKTRHYIYIYIHKDFFSIFEDPRAF